jgi:hypothetical protein
VLKNRFLYMTSDNDQRDEPDEDEKLQKGFENVHSNGVGIPFDKNICIIYRF